MLRLMKHIQYMYDPVKTLDGKREFMVFLKDGVWQILEANELVTMSNDAEFILKRLDSLGANLKQLESTLRCHIATEAVVQLQAVDKCRNLVGQELIDTSYKEWKKFGKELGRVIRKSQWKVLRNEDL